MRTIYLDKLLRLTLTRKGKAVAKHPLLRENAVEAIKAMPSQFETTSLWETCKATPTPPANDDEPQALWRHTLGGWQ